MHIHLHLNKCTVFPSSGLALYLHFLFECFLLFLPKKIVKLQEKCAFVLYGFAEETAIKRKHQKLWVDCTTLATRMASLRNFMYTSKCTPTCQMEHNGQ